MDGRMDRQMDEQREEREREEAGLMNKHSSQEALVFTEGLYGSGSPK